jgi:hypothetical protein
LEQKVVFSLKRGEGRRFLAKKILGVKCGGLASPPVEECQGSLFVACDGGFKNKQKM